MRSLVRLGQLIRAVRVVRWMGVFLSYSNQQRQHLTTSLANMQRERERECVRHPPDHRNKQNAPNAVPFLTNEVDCTTRPSPSPLHQQVETAHEAYTTTAFRLLCVSHSLRRQPQAMTCCLAPPPPTTNLPTRYENVVQETLLNTLLPIFLRDMRSCSTAASQHNSPQQSRRREGCLYFSFEPGQHADQHHIMRASRGNDAGRSLDTKL